MFIEEHLYPKHGWEIRWKIALRFPNGYYDRLKYFATKYPEYNEDILLDQMKKKRRYLYEDDKVIIKRVPYIRRMGIPGERPKLKDRLFWEYDIPNVDWNECYVSVIARVLARGVPEEWDEIVRFYGMDTVLNVFMNQSLEFWPPLQEENARMYFNLEREDLLIHHHRLLHPEIDIWAAAAKTTAATTDQSSR